MTLSREVTWTALKSVLDAKGIAAQGTEDAERYLILAVDGPLVFETALLKANRNADLEDFETNYKPSWNTVLAPRDALNREIYSTTAFAVNTDYEVKATGFKGSAAPGVTTDLDHLVGAEDRYINGLALVTDSNAVMGDTVDFKVVDKDGVLAGVAYPEETELPVTIKQFGFDWNVAPGQVQQAIFNYLARLPAGLYVRVSYNSTGENTVAVGVNLFLHKKVAV